MALVCVDGNSGAFYVFVGNFIDNSRQSTVDSQWLMDCNGLWTVDSPTDCTDNTDFVL